MSAIRVFTIALTMVLTVEVQATAAPCESLSALTIPNAQLTVAESIAAGSFVPAGAPLEPAAQTALRRLPSFCRVALILRPSSRSEIKTEVWMPLVTWNGKFEGIGNPAWAGSIPYTSASPIVPGMADALVRGYAVAGTDTGHSGNSAAALLGEPEKLIDFGYRAVHEMTVVAKVVVAAFYSTTPKFSYWDSCSTGGRQGLMEAQRYPADYDGIIAGAPVLDLRPTAVRRLKLASAVLSNPSAAIPSFKYQTIHRAVIAACDRIDGIPDGIIDDPRRCRFDPIALQCKEGDATDCLTAPQVDLARQILAPVIDPRTGTTIADAVEPGSELGWALSAGLPPNNGSLEFLRSVVFQDSQWDWRTFDFARDTPRVVAVDDPLHATEPRLSSFVARGGKLLLFHGWNDPNIAPQSTLRYYEQLKRETGSPDSWLRLFMVPGMAHCGGGDGPNAFDPLSALERWVEEGQIPSIVQATQTLDGHVIRTRPLCAYPSVARHNGSGSTDDAASFRCEAAP